MERRILTSISLAELEHIFAESEENLENDLSVIRVSMIRDVHDESIELYVLVYGQGCSEEDAPVAEFWLDPEVIGNQEELSNGGVEPCRLRAIFCEELWHLIVGLNIPIQWLCEDGSLMTVSLFRGEDNGFRLQPMDQ